VFIDVAVNSHNNTLFVFLSELDTEVMAEIDHIVCTTKGLHVRYIKGVAPYSQLKKWYNKLDFEYLKKEIGWTSSGLTLNGTIIIRVEKLTPEVVEKTYDLIKGDIPPGVIVMTECSGLIEEGIQDRTRPLEGGLRIQSRPNAISRTNASIGFIVTEEGESDEAMILSGHATYTGISNLNDVWQVKKPDDKVGDTILDPDGPRYSDASWTTIDSGVSAVSEIYSNYEVNVVGQVNSSSGFYDGMPVEMTGQETGYTNGYITDLEQDVNSAFYTTLYDQTFADYSSQGGDSGAPVYNKYYEGGGWNANALGIHVGTTGGGDKVFSPVNNIEDDFNKDIDFTGGG